MISQTSYYPHRFFRQTTDQMGFEFYTPLGGKRARWLSQKALVDRLAWLLPQVAPGEINVHTTELSGNASFVQFVRLHRLTYRPTGTVLHVVEKSIRKLVGISSLETRFYREGDMLKGSKHFQHPRCYGVIETPWESLIFCEYVQGLAPHMPAIAAQVAQGIAELESRTHDHLKDADLSQRWRHWQMDFFRPWYLMRPRFRFAQYLSYLKPLAADDPQFEGLEHRLRGFVKELHDQAVRAKPTPHCFCHLDYLRKNLFLSPQGLQLIDWSEVKIGRVGFDAGSYLSAVYRRSEMPRYEQVRDLFLASYRQALDARFDIDQVMANVRYVFLLNSLWHCLRPKTIAEFQQRGKLPLLAAKLRYLLALKPL